MKIERWFQGRASCDGVKGTLGVGGIRWRHLEPGLDFGVPAEEDKSPQCLAFTGWGFSQRDAITLIRLSDIVQRLYPERWCQCPTVDSHVTERRLVHFNNHPDTTRADIDKILHTYTLEHE